MRLTQLLQHLDRIPEVLNCLQRCQQPGETIRRYLSGADRGYPFEMELTNGVQIHLENFHDLVTAWVIFCRDEYRVPPGSKTILDLGANIGCFSLLAAANCPDTQIVAVEPFPSTFSKLSANIQQNSCGERVTCLSVGVAAKSGQRLMLDDGPSQSRGILSDGASTPNGIEINVFSVEELLSQACDRFQVNIIDFVKIDIEGGEHEALLSASTQTLSKVRRIGMEYHPNQPKKVLFEHLVMSGFQLESDCEFGANVGVAHFCHV